MNYWLLKSEPSTFSVEDLATRPGQRTSWDGVRSYQARNYLRAMKRNDLAFFYHSSARETGIVGIVKVVAEAYPDPTAFDPQDAHYDVDSDPAQPAWYVVDVKLVRRLQRVIALAELKDEPALQGMTLLKRGNRLSVMPVQKAHWEVVMSLEAKAPALDDVRSARKSKRLPRRRPAR